MPGGIGVHYGMCALDKEPLTSPGGIWVYDTMCVLDRAPLKGPGGIWVQNGRCALGRALPLRRPRWYMAASWHVGIALWYKGCMMTCTLWRKRPPLPRPRWYMGA